MSMQPTEFVSGCPSWCRNAGVVGAVRVDGSAVEDVHAHVSEDIEVGEAADPMTAKMIQLAGSDLVRVVVGQQVLGVEDAQSFARALLRLASAAQPAEPGLGFVEILAARTGASTGEIALAAGLDVERVRAQRAGGRVLSVLEFDRVALAVAQLVALEAVQTDPK